jgi:hypothetical protein
VLGCRSTPACLRLLRTGRFARRGSWATPVRDRFCSLVMANSTFPAAIGLRRGGPVVQVQVDPSVVPSVRYSYHQPEIVHMPFRRPGTISADIVASPQAKG